MSHDQKPAKIRVVSSGATTVAPQRRRGDTQPLPASAAGASTPAAAGPSRFPTLLVLILFLVGCAIGGSALPLLGLV